MTPTDTHASDPTGAQDARLERAIVLELLRSEHARGRSRGQLAAGIDAAAAELERALARLAADGVVTLAGDAAAASCAARRLDELGLIAI